MAQKISVWIDRTNGKPTVIVSLDTDDHSSTLRTYHVRWLGTAKDYARAEAKRRGIPAVIETPDQSGIWRSL